jgi:hypothetical protein
MANPTCAKHGRKIMADDFEEIEATPKKVAIECVEQEPDFKGEMPGSLYSEFKWGVYADDKEYIANIIRTIVKITKKNIIKRIGERM